MSYLYRTGNSRNNIAFTSTANSSTRYLRRLGSGRTNINWYTIPQGSTYNILQRNGTGRNNILWANLNIPKPVGEPSSSTDITNIKYVPASGSTIICTITIPISLFNGLLTLGSTRVYNIYVRGDTLTSAIFSGTSENQSGSNKYLLADSAGSGISHGSLPNAKKCTIWWNSQYITAHLSLRSQSSRSCEFNVSEYKSNIPSGTSGYTFDGDSCRVVFNLTW